MKHICRKFCRNIKINDRKEEIILKLQVADRMKDFEAGIFQVLDAKRLEVSAQGRKVYNFSVGTPDFQPAPHIMEAVAEAAKKPEN